MTLPTPDELWPELEKLGVDEVRKRLVQNVYGDRKLSLVKEWLRRKDEEESAARAAADTASRSDEIDILRSTKNAAWIAAVAALLSIAVSVLALVVASRSSP